MRNLRDVGGHRTRDGATIARGLAYRSDALGPLSAEDLERLHALGLKFAYDLRTTFEVEARPDDLPPGVQHLLLDVLADSQSAAAADLDGLMRDPRKTNAELGGGRIEALVMETYRKFVTLPSASRSYGTLFQSLADRRKLPAVFHCTGGKDRTGWAAAALQTLLGVPEETVLADYLRTNEHSLPKHQRTIDDFAAAGGERAVLVAIFGVKAEYLEASFDEVRQRYGTVEGYFSKGLGIDAAEQQALRELYLETS